MLRVVVLCSLLMSLIACSSSPEWKGVYGTDAEEIDAASLEVPPDLSEPNITSNLAIPNISSAGSTYSAYNNTDYKGTKITPANPANVKLVRDGALQWLEVKATAESLWPELRNFFKQVGFEIKREDKQIGVMETNWLENRHSLPTNWFSKLLSKISSTGIRDKYRARLEKTTQPGVTRVFITHQGLKEKSVEDISSIKVWWEVRPSDPELESEMYQRFLIFRQYRKADALKIVSKTSPAERTRIVEKDSIKTLKVNEGFDRTWRRVGIALDRIGLLVEDRDRSAGLYYLRITKDFKEKVKEEEGWFASLFSSSKVKLKERYLLSVAKDHDKTSISISETTGAKAEPRFVEQLLKDLKLYLD